MSDKTDTLPKEPPAEDFTIRCPRLGHQINFSYCQIENSGIPCFKTLDCWYTYFDVQSFLEDKLSKDDFKKAFVEKGQPKVLSLLDLIEKAKAKKGKKS
ncbi:MAG: hypothetical protein PF690_16905 [Deltaproteobacteria bacterium]|jgi:hypothetical protein|nr:hypothetical protein [Deltaproteobacteria bacterium]